MILLHLFFVVKRRCTFGENQLCTAHYEYSVGHFACWGWEDGEDNGWGGEMVYDVRARTTNIDRALGLSVSSCSTTLY